MDVDDDIEFDFFEDEAATTEASQQRVRLPRRTSGPRRRIGPPRGAAPLVRLLLLVGFVVVIVVFFSLAIQSCASASKHDSYAHYMDDVSTIAAQSASNGKSLASTLTTQGLNLGQIETKLRGIAAQEQQNVSHAESLTPPGRLRDDHLHVIEALQLRVSGVLGLAAALQKTASSKNTTADSLLLANQARRLDASDVVWDDLFRTPSIAQLQHDGVSGVDVPASHFVAHPELLTAASMASELERIRGAATGTPAAGLHGTNLGNVTAEPGGQVLSAAQLTTVTATTDLAFQVVVQNSGDFQEVQIPVTLTIERPSAQGGPIVKTQTIDVINPGEDKVLTFGNLGQVPFASQVNVRVDVKAVPGEERVDNNSTVYPVIFSLP